MQTLPTASGKPTPCALFSLPGFLGHPADWQGLLVDNEQYQHVPCDYYAYTPPAAGLRAWADAFNRHTGGMGADKRLLLGYSLGGRLAMHALCRTPELWSAAIFISAHPGLPPHERTGRLARDEQWARRFESESLEHVFHAWNSQPLFDSAPFPALRPSHSYDRTLLAATLRGWSLGKQHDLRPQLAAVNVPILWLYGERDERYSTIASTLEFKHPFSRLAAIPQAAHRLPWQQPEAFQKILKSFCQQLQTELCSV